MTSFHDKIMQTPFRESLETDPILNALVKNEISWAESDMLEDAITNSIQNNARSYHPCTFNPLHKNIIIRNIPRDTTSIYLSHMLQQYGQIVDIYIPRNRDLSSPYYGTIKGFAIIKFLTAYHAYNAMVNAPSHIYNNRIYIEYAKQNQ